MGTPKKLTPTPLLLSSINVKFDSKIPAEAIFGILYQNFQRKLGNFKSFKMPIADIPLEILENDKNLKFAPLYTLINDDKKYSLQIGNKIASIVYDKAYGYEYEGWNKYFKDEIGKFVECIRKSNIDDIIGLEYQNVDFFEDNIFDNVNVNINVECPYECNNNQLSFTTKIDNTINTIHINNDSKVMINRKKFSGSIIDIRTFEEANGIEISILDNMHKINKELFFSIIKGEYINEKFNPIY